MSNKHSMNNYEIWRELSGKLHGYLLVNVKNEEVAKDILQDVFLKILEKKKLFKSDENYRGWVFRITENLMIDYFRKNKKNNELQIITDTYESSEDLPESYERLMPALNEFINNLPRKYKNPLILSDLKGMKQKQIAKRLNLSLSGAKSRIQRARQLLKKKFLECSSYEFDKQGRIIDFHPNSNKCVCNRT
jgi:RNA polymerase sigma-70 factor (ECF subfamily)